MAVVVEEPILSRIDRLDNMLKQLEEIRGSSRSTRSSSGTSTPSRGTPTSGGRSSSTITSPKSIEEHCPPINYVITETEAKGTLVERLDIIESRIVKLCFQMEQQELEAEKKREGTASDKKARKKGLKQIVRKLLGGGGKHRTASG